MPNPKYGISFPFKDSQEGLFLHMNVLPEDEVRSNLIHLVLSVKGSTNLMKHIFEPLDTGTRTSIDLEIRDAVKQFIPNLNITDVEIKSAEDLRDEDIQEEDPTRDQKTFSFSDKKHGVNEYTLRLRIDYSIGSGVFEARDYTERDFLGVRNELVRLTNRYYPDLIRNANDASMYSVFLDLNAAVADNLNFQIDRTFQETVLQYAQERSSLYNLARTYGLKVPGNRPSLTVCEVSIIVPALGDKEDFRYLGLLRRGSQFKGGGNIFELMEDCDFSTQYNNEGIVNRTKIPNLGSTGIIRNYTITKKVLAVNGVTKVFKKEITDVLTKPFYKLFLPENNVVGVTSVIQKEGTGYQSLPTNIEFMDSTANKWYEVDALAQEEVFVIGKIP